MHTFEEILDHFGGTHEAMASQLGCSREAISMWNGEIPELRGYQIEVLSEGKFRFANLPIRRRTSARSRNSRAMV